MSSESLSSFAVKLETSSCLRSLRRIVPSERGTDKLEIQLCSVWYTRVHAASKISDDASCLVLDRVLAVGLVMDEIQSCFFSFLRHSKSSCAFGGRGVLCSLSVWRQHRVVVAAFSATLKRTSPVARDARQEMEKRKKIHVCALLTTTTGTTSDDDVLCIDTICYFNIENRLR